MTTMVTSRTALSAAEDERCSCVETTTAAGEVSPGLCWAMEVAGGGRNHNNHNVASAV